MKRVKDSVEQYLREQFEEAAFDMELDGGLFCSDSNRWLDPKAMAEHIQKLVSDEGNAGNVPEGDMTAAGYPGKDE